MVYAVTMQRARELRAGAGAPITSRGTSHSGSLPHAFRGANAFFDPTTNSVLFGYFAADASDPGENLPGQTVFTCLSHDIVAHEVTHAIVHRLREHYNEPTNLDVLAFHEGFADIVAIFQHFTFPDVLRNAIRNASAATSPAAGTLLELAKQFGHATGRAATALAPASCDGEADAEGYDDLDRASRARFPARGGGLRRLLRRLPESHPRPGPARDKRDRRPADGDIHPTS